MNTKLILISGTILFLIVLGLGTSFYKGNSATEPTSSTVPTTIMTNLTPKPTDFTASFEIYTNGTKRIFTDPKYHQQSSEVYLTAEMPSTIYIKKEGIT